MSNEIVFDFDEIKKRLPHSYPFIFVDQVKQLIPHKHIISVKNITGNEWMFPGHFPSQAVYPGVLLQESIAQSTILFFQGSYKDQPIHDCDRMWVLVGTKSRFLNAAYPGDQVTFTCTPQKMLSTGSIIMDGVGYVDTVPIIRSTLTVTRTMKKKLKDAEKIESHAL